MRFHKNVPQKNREYLKGLLAKYEPETAMSEPERQELYEWVAKGRSHYEHGDYVFESNGGLLDFVTARRAVEEQLEWFQGLGEEKQAREDLEENSRIVKEFSNSVQQLNEGLKAEVNLRKNIQIELDKKLAENTNEINNKIKFVVVLQVN